MTILLRTVILSVLLVSSTAEAQRKDRACCAADHAASDQIGVGKVSTPRSAKPYVFGGMAIGATAVGLTYWIVEGDRTEAYHSAVIGPVILVTAGAVVGGVIGWIVYKARGG
jgi:hypothetical protein